MKVEQLVPETGPVDVEKLLARVTASAARLEPLGDTALDFAAELSRILFHDPAARRHAELQSLAFWMRKAELSRLREEFSTLESASTMRVARGLVFHVPPSNVDTIFVYSWILSLLAGNANVIRLSGRAGEASAVLCRILNEALRSADPRLRAGIAVLRYGHDDEINAALSAACDVRVLWGGDASIDRLRRVPLAPHARELTFADRYSLAVIGAAAYLACGEAEKRDLATRFFNDTFWFDQMACASPRLVLWIGDASRSAEASHVFYELLAEEVKAKRYALATGQRLRKLAFAYGAMIDRPVARYETFGSEVTVIHLEHVRDFDRAHSGGGLLFQAYLSSLGDVVPALARRDQTLTHFGFGIEELRDLARRWNGRAVDRLVPLGQALTFSRFWDGYDLLAELTRIVHVQA